MPFEITAHEIKVRVHDEPAIVNVNNPAAGMFLPDFAFVQYDNHEPFTVTVSGPLLNPRTAMTYKTKRGLASFDASDMDSADTPAWLVELYREVTGKTG